MDEDDLHELVLAIDTHGALSGEDSFRLITEVRRLLDTVASLEAQVAAARRLVDETLDPDDPPRPLTDADDPADWGLVTQSPEREP